MRCSNEQTNDYWAKRVWLYYQRPKSLHVVCLPAQRCRDVEAHNRYQKSLRASAPHPNHLIHCFIVPNPCDVRVHEGYQMPVSLIMIAFLHQVIINPHLLVKGFLSQGLTHIGSHLSTKDVSKDCERADSTTPQRIVDVGATRFGLNAPQRLNSLPRYRLSKPVHLTLLFSESLHGTPVNPRAPFPHESCYGSIPYSFERPMPVGCIR